MVRFFLYGTLQEGQRNERRLLCESREKGVLHDFMKIEGGRAPHIVPCKGSCVEGELVECALTPYRLLRLDLFEWKYKRTKVVVNGKECWTYVWRKHFKEQDKR